VVIVGNLDNASYALPAGIFGKQNSDVLNAECDGNDGCVGMCTWFGGFMHVLMLRLYEPIQHILV
jgi:hypothetical protein